MLLTSTSLQILTIVLAVLATAAALLLWNRVRGPRAVRVASRVGLLAGGYVATAVAVLISVNIAYGGLIVSWSDLFSNVNPPMVPHLKHPGGGAGGGAAGDYGFGWDGPDRPRPTADPGVHPGPNPGAVPGAIPDTVMTVGPSATPSAPAALRAASDAQEPQPAGAAQ